MPLSRYLKVYPDATAPGFLILYSTIKGAVVRVPELFVAAAQQDRLAQRERELLRRLEIYVDDPETELQRIKGVIARSNQRAGIFRGTVVLNLDCNLDCTYCFERNFREGRYMSEETAALLVERLTRDHLNQGRNLDLNFYGGEPLLSLSVLESIAETLRERARDRGLRFTFSMVTNGTLLTRSLVEKLLPLGFVSAQVTLDGPGHIHDRLRPFASGSGSYDIVLGNIAAAFDLIRLKLGGNYDRDNYHHYPLVLDELLAAGVDPERLDPVFFAPIVPQSGASSFELARHCTGSGEPWLNDAALYLREETLKRGFAVPKTVIGSCMVELEHDLVVNYDGSLYKCPCFMGWPELSVGSLLEGIKDFSESHRLGIWKNDTCLECPYLPICFGGCRLMPLLRHGEIDEVDCRKEFFDATLEGMILQDLKYKEFASPRGGMV